MEKTRCYFVIDMKSFFASVECAERGLDAMTTNLVVADSNRTEKTICLAVSPSMKALGVKNRCRLYEIPKNIDYIIARPRMAKYIEYSAEIFGIYLKYIDKNDIHVYSIDECFLDVTDYLKIYKLRAKDFAKKLMQEIEDKLHIPSTCGIGTNLFLAKIALDITAKKSSDRIGWLTEEKFKKELWEHTPITDFWSISTGTANRLAKYGIYNMKGISIANEDLLYKEFGINAELLIDHSNGKESCLMQDIKNYKHKSHSISSAQILPFGYSYQDALTVMKEMLQEGSYRLINEKVVTSNVSLYISYENDRSIASKGSINIPYKTNLYSHIEPFTTKLFEKIAIKDKKIRRLGYSFNNLISDEYEQYDLFTDYEMIKKEKQLVFATLKIKDKFGKNAILKGIDYMPNSTQRERNQQIGGHRSGENEDA